MFSHPIGPPSNVRLSDSIPPIHGIGQSDVTIEWTPPPNGGNDVMYTVGTTPAPLSGAMSVTTSSTQANITVTHNTTYTVTVTMNTTCGEVQNVSGTIHIGEWGMEECRWVSFGVKTLVVGFPT